jgi:hypothetical protein
MKNFDISQEILCKIDLLEHYIYYSEKENGGNRLAEYA